MDVVELIRCGRNSFSVPEFRKMLGIGKTESYWILKHRKIETVTIHGQIRILRPSFQEWYRHQTKYQIIGGPPPGEALRETSYSVKELAELLAVSEDTIYTRISRGEFETFTVDYCIRITKASFERWYSTQEKLRKPEDRAQDAQLLEETYSMPEIARMLGVHRNTIYGIVSNEKNRNVFEIVKVSGQQRITIESFEAWLYSQKRYKIIPQVESNSEVTTADKELQRVSRKTLSALDGKDVMLEFPATTSVTSTVLVLKSPKTESSVRKVFLPKAVAHMLAEWKQAQDEKIELLGSEYQDFNLVFAGALGLPTEASTINAALRRLIKENDLPPVVFHSFRHASITYKLKLNGGDIKAVQGDSGHSQVKMVTDVYSHILDDDRKNNAQLFQEAFYDKKDTKQPKPSIQLPDGISPETLAKMLASPEIAALLGALAKNM